MARSSRERRACSRSRIPRSPRGPPQLGGYRSQICSARLIQRLSAQKVTDTNAGPIRVATDQWNGVLTRINVDAQPGRVADSFTEFEPAKLPAASLVDLPLIHESILSAFCPCLVADRPQSAPRSYAERSSFIGLHWEERCPSHPWTVLKTTEPATVPGVRIPLPPPFP